MKNLEDFYNNFITEMSRPKGSKNKPKVWPNDAKKVAEDPEVKNAIPADKVDIKDIETTGPKMIVGKSSKDAKYDVDSPEPDWAEKLAKFDIEELDDNSYELSERFDDKHDFLVLGEAGWAKTSIIKQMAKRHGYHVLTVYLDKAVATDLGGIPVPEKDEDTDSTHVNYAIPEWALYMLQHPNDKFLLFFDEMNQAQDDVLNALMPIILEHVVCSIRFDNFFVGAAGNLLNENASLAELNGPLLDRLKPVIEWEVHTEESWNAAFKYIHSVFDKTIGKEIVNKLQDMSEYWKSPRDLSRIILEFVNANMGRSERKYTRPRLIVSHLKSCVWSEADTNSNTFKKQMDELAEYISSYIKGEDKAEGSRRKFKGTDNVDKGDKAGAKKALEAGYFTLTADIGGDGSKYLCTLENIISGKHEIMSSKETGITAEVLRKIVKEMEAEGKSVKYKTWDEGVKDVQDKKLDIITDFESGDEE